MICGTKQLSFECAAQLILNFFDIQGHTEHNSKHWLLQNKSEAGTLATCFSADDKLLIFVMQKLSMTTINLWLSHAWLTMVGDLIWLQYQFAVSLILKLKCFLICPHCKFHLFLTMSGRFFLLKIESNFRTLHPSDCNFGISLLSLEVHNDDV